ncbi:hypothetical protein [uncultured Pantoea sp.]|uniref:hypothetical protein n=1 Tax=uncultured Pantoea sp. TaxID=218084 RepID=UPI0035A6C646
MISCASLCGQFAGNMANTMLASTGDKGHAEGTTQSAVANGTIVVRDQANQKQDTATLSRDTAHANDSISPIFNKEKEQQRLQTAHMIGEIGSQVADIARTQGEIGALKEAQKVKGPAPEGASEKVRNAYIESLKPQLSTKKQSLTPVPEVHYSGGFRRPPQQCRDWQAESLKRHWLAHPPLTSPN